MSGLDAAVLGLLSPLDRARSSVLRRFARGAGKLARDRALRVALLAALSIASALLFTLAAPLTLLTVGPLLLGVPHLLADLRYLVVRQGLHRRRALLPAALCLALAVVQPGWHWGACALFASVLAARCGWRMRVAAFSLCAAATLGACALGPSADVLFAHGHNLVALAVWAAWARELRAMWPALALFCAAGAAILTGLGDPWLLRSEALTEGALSLHPDQLLAGLSLSRDPACALRWLGFFAFAQAVHYGVWLRVLPDEDRRRSAVRSYRASYHALVIDLGRPLLFAALLVFAGIVVSAGSDVGQARDAYLRLALFHGPLELSVFALLALERRALRREEH